MMHALQFLPYLPEEAVENVLRSHRRGWPLGYAFYMKCFQIVMMASLVCIGTFPAIFNYVERRGRHPAHHYMDYCLFNFLLALIFAVTLGQIGKEDTMHPNFATQISQNNGPAVGFAFGSGFFLCMGNVLMQYAIPFAGLSISEMLIASCNVTVGTTLNYFLDGRINSAKILFPGVGCFLLAVLMGAFTHVSKEKDKAAHRLAMAGMPLGDSYSDRTTKKHRENPRLAAPVGSEMPNPKSTLDDSAHGGKPSKEGKDVEKAADEPLSEPGADVSSLRGSLLAIQDGPVVQQFRSISGQTKYPVLLGVFLAIASGCCDGFFSPAFNLSTNDQWHKLPHGVVPLSVYTSYFWFCMSFMICGMLISIYFMYRPPLGVAKTNIFAWMADNHCRIWSCLAGLICGLGNGFQFMAGQAAGYAAADSVQAFPLVGTAFGILLFKEYHNTTWKTKGLLTCMIALFCAAVALLASSSSIRPGT